MYNASFFRSKLGHASLASVAAMALMIAFTGQMTLGVEDAHIAQPSGETTMLVELA
ncbi:hypothetical protein [Erythrobacter sp. KY5]|uniref:hypothetical protein n=1 Tax=Erythrobacter sp. KY5 TaxID=2011159 RepID=UPI0013A6AB13|nr:hypothetical protein [Erythrobacter sp. KY5]